MCFCLFFPIKFFIYFVSMSDSQIFDDYSDDIMWKTLESVSHREVWWLVKSG